MELPFLANRGCLLATSGAGESALFSLQWPASNLWPADMLRDQPGAPANPVAGDQALVRPAASWPPLPDVQAFAQRVALAGEGGSARLAMKLWHLPEEVATVLGRIRMMSLAAGWSEMPGGGRGTVWFEKGPRLRIVTATDAGVTLQEGLPEQEAA